MSIDEARKRWNEAHREEISAYNRELYKKRREQILEYQRKYKKEHPEEISEQAKRHANKHPDRRKARTLINKLIKNRKLVKPTTCSICGSIDRIEGHHEDYSKPLEVEWLCYGCHQQKKEDSK